LFTIVYKKALNKKQMYNSCFSYMHKSCGRTIYYSRSVSRLIRAIPSMEKPEFRHAAIQGSLAIAIAAFLATSYSWDLTAQTATSLLNLGGIKTNYASALFLMYVRLLDGTVAGFQVLIECSGLITLAVFSFISTFTIGLLKGSLLVKLFWFAVSLAVGLAWNVSRLVFVVAVAYNFGISAFSFAHYVLSPSIDFVWIVSMWALGMSHLKRKKEVAL